MKFTIKKWNPLQQLQPTSTVLLIGKRGSGKSVLMKDIAYRLHQTGNIDFAAAFSPTEDTQGSFASFLPSSAIHDDYDEAVINNILESQKQSWRQGHGRTISLLLDDCCYDKAILRSKTIRNLFLNGRHRHVGLVMASQYCLDMGPDLRTNTDIIICCRESIRGNREKLWKSFAGMFNTFDEFSKTMDATTNNYECLVILNNSQSNDISDNIFWYKAEMPVPEFRLGSSTFWKLHQRFHVDRSAEYEQLKLRQSADAAAKANPNIDEVVKDGADDDGEQQPLFAHPF